MVSKIEDTVESITSEIEKVAVNELKESETDKVVQEDVEAVTQDNTNPEDYKKDLLSKESWEDLGVKENITKGLMEMMFIKPSKIQAVAFELIKNNPDKHLVAQSQNGSGKTGGFGIPTVSLIDDSINEVQAVVLSHNREMVKQNTRIISSIAKFTNISVKAVEKDTSVEKAQIVVCTSGMFQKIFLDKKSFSLNYLKVIVLDEADYLISNDNVRVVLQNLFTYINKSAPKVQVLFFSATFTKDHYKFISSFFKGKVLSIKVEKESLTLKTVRQMFIKCKGDKDEKIEEYLKSSIENERVIIFVNSKNNVVQLQKRLISKGYKVFVLMGGDMDPANRDETVKRFNLGQIQILITTDLLSRGFDEKLVKLIINYDLPLTKDKITDTLVPAMDTYLHRIGRTGRFGTRGIGLTLVDEKYLNNIYEIQKFYSSTIEEIVSMDTLISEFKNLLNQY